MSNVKMSQTHTHFWKNIYFWKWEGAWCSSEMWETCNDLQEWEWGVYSTYVTYLHCPQFLGNLSTLPPILSTLIYPPSIFKVNFYTVICIKINQSDLKTVIYTLLNTYSKDGSACTPQIIKIVVYFPKKHISESHLH